MKTRSKFSSRWFRMYDEVVDDPKIQTLGDKLGFFWLNCMCLASKNGGYLPPIPQIAWKLRKTEQAISAMIASLHERGLLDPEADTFTPHNWDERQYCSDVSTERVRRFRDKQKRSETVSETPDETFHETPVKRFETVSETPPEQSRAETEQKQSRPPQRFDPMPGWMKFKLLYPEHRINEFTDLRLWISLVENQETQDRVISGLRLFLPSVDWTKDGGKFVPKAENFLSKRIFETTPTPESASNGKPDFQSSIRGAITKMIERNHE